ncbi:MAG: CBS domain-containing protein [Planctomycetes bacterium]|nr:CBS domain-containing protein [Planctomycetota bacterium]
MAIDSRNLVIVGGGFAGVYTAHYLLRRLPPDWRLILFSQENHFIFTPLLGDVVGSAINPMHVVCPVRQMAPGAICRTAALTGLDLPGRAVLYKSPDGRMARQPYDHLVLACGAAVNSDILPGMAAHGWPFKTMGDALLLRNHLIGMLEKAEVEPDPAIRKRLLSVVVVGAGFSGVEVAGEVYDLLAESCKFYPSLGQGDIRVTLLQGGNRILPELPESLSRFAQRKMTRRGIDIRLNARGHSVTESGIYLDDGSFLDAGTVICTIGFTAGPLLVASRLPLVKHRLKTDPDMRVAGQEHVWAVGDCAAVPNTYDNSVSGPTAQVAIRQARHLANNILATIRGQPVRPFAYKPLGMLASIGNHNAVGMVFGLKISGFLAWFVWRGIYLSKMPTFARKLQIAFDWAWQLFFPRDIVQLNLGPTERLGRAHFEPGQFVFHKGDPGDKFYIIERGRADVYLDDAAPPIAQLGAGDHFGEGALLSGTPRSASVRAVDPLDLVVVGPNSFGQLTGHLGVLRAALERSARGSRSASRLLTIARDNPLLNTRTVASVMSRPVDTLPVHLTFGEALRISQEKHKGAYPIVDDAGKLVGLCTRSDYYNAMQDLRSHETPLREVMRQPVITIRESDTLTAALLLFLREPIKRLVVVASDDPERPVGMLTPFDVIKVLSGQVMDLAM